MSPIKSSLAKSAKQLIGLFNTADLGLRGATQNTRQIIPPIVTTGGTKSTYNGKTIHAFTSTGPFTLTGGPGSVSIEYVVIGGGGGGGRKNGGGGGGAGGYLTGSVPVTGPLTVNIGGGGSGSGVGAGANGNDTSVSGNLPATLTAAGGG